MSKTCNFFGQNYTLALMQTYQKVRAKGEPTLEGTCMNDTDLDE